MIQNQFNSKIQVLKTDKARDYFNSTIGDNLLDQGIIHKNSCVDIHQNNKSNLNWWPLNFTGLVSCTLNCNLWQYAP